MGSAYLVIMITPNLILHFLIQIILDIFLKLFMQLILKENVMKRLHSFILWTSLMIVKVCSY